MGKKNKKDKKNKNLPTLKNGMSDLMLKNMPELPQIIQNAMPVELPRASFNQGSIELFFGNIKRRQLVAATKAEYDIADYSNKAVKAKLDTIHEVVTYSARVADTLGQYGHSKTMRALDQREKIADIFIKEAQAQQIGYEVKLSELDYNIRLKQFKKMEEDDTIDV